MHNLLPFTPNSYFLGDPVVPPPPPPDWLWEGYLAAKNVTLLAGRWKAGKTTLLSILLARLKTGGQLAGLPIAQGSAVVVSEEDDSLWQQRHAQLDFGRIVCLISRPFQNKPRPEQWRALIDHIADVHARHPFRLAVFDALADFLPGRDENNSFVMLESLYPLRRLTALGLALLLIHHPRKGEPLPGEIARGSSALSSHVDILMEMTLDRPTDDEDNRRRLLRAYSRHRQTPRRLLLELNIDHNDYTVHDPVAAGHDLVVALLECAERKLSGADLLSRWPPDQEPPHRSTLYRWLEGAVQTGLLHRDGPGSRDNPFRYWLASRMQLWLKDPDAVFRMPELFEAFYGIKPLPELDESA
jgi:hypothetical protein